MVDYDLMIKGGTIVTASDTCNADIGIRGGKICAVAESGLGSAHKIIDATGCLTSAPMEQTRLIV